MISDLFVCLLVAPAGQPLEKELEDDVVVILFNNIHEKAPTWICRIRAIFLQLSPVGRCNRSSYYNVANSLLSIECPPIISPCYVSLKFCSLWAPSFMLIFLSPPLSLSSNVNDEINLKSTIGQSFFPPFQLTARPCRVGGQKKHFNGRVFFYFGWNGQKRRTCAPKHSHTHTCINSPDPSVRVCGWVRRHTHK